MFHQTVRIALFALFTASVLTMASRSLAGPVPEPLREFRGTWVATVYNIDWPSKPGLSAGQQKAELVRVLDTARGLNLNAVILQVRPACDVLYRSKEPWSRFLTGASRRSPGYDPLAFAVKEAHGRGLELHAWFNPFRALPSNKEKIPAGHIAGKRPGWVRKYENKVWLDPGIPEVRKYALGTMMDVVARYDIDGVHIDDYFYPYPNNPKKRPIPEFPDASTFKKYGRGDIGEWRRNNINTFVRSLYSSVKKKKPWVKVGISPFGIWRPQQPPGVHADLDSVSMIYADSRLWLQQGWCDYLMPQLYWRISGEQSFSALNRWWAGQNSRGRHLWPGMASSRINSSTDRGRPASEIISQIGVTRKTLRAGQHGHCHWSFTPLRQDRGGVAGQLRKTYPTKALIPASPWLGRGRLSQPQVGVNGATLRWKPGRGSKNLRWWVVQVQDRPDSGWRTAEVLWKDQTSYAFGAGVPAAAAVRAMDAYGNLGKPTSVGLR